MTGKYKQDGRKADHLTVFSGAGENTQGPPQLLSRLSCMLDGLHVPLEIHSSPSSTCSLPQEAEPQGLALMGSFCPPASRRTG